MLISSTQSLTQPPRLRVTMLTNTFRPLIGGTEMQIERLAPALAAQGIGVTILTRHVVPGTPRTEAIPGATVHRLWSAGPKGAASLLFTLLATAYALRHQGEIDLFHAHGVLSPLTAALASKRLLERPLVVKLLHSDDLRRMKAKFLGKPRLAYATTHVDGFLAISRAIRDLLVTDGVPEDRIFTIPSGVDTDRFHPLPPTTKAHLRHELGLPADARIGLYAGRLQPTKNLALLLLAWQQGGRGLLVLVGDGPDRARLEALAQALHLGSSVRFLGASNAVYRFMQAADWFVQPSSGEGLSSAMLEAMACGLPGIYTRVSGTEDVVTHDESGLLVPPGDVAALADAIRELTASQAARDDLGVRAREVIEGGYSILQVAEQMDALYARLVTRA